MNRIDNPPAFPRPASRGKDYLTGEEDVVVDPQDGMTLLDYFAGQVARGLAAQSDETDRPGYLALRAYKIAREMMEVRGTFRP